MKVIDIHSAELLALESIMLSYVCFMTASYLDKALILVVKLYVIYEF